MSVRLTSGENKVALFDSTSGFAFGPVFDDETEAEAFLDFAERNLEGDIRGASDADLLALYRVHEQTYA